MIRMIITWLFVICTFILGFTIWSISYIIGISEICNIIENMHYTFDETINDGFEIIEGG